VEEIVIAGFLNNVNVCNNHSDVTWNKQEQNMIYNSCTVHISTSSINNTANPCDAARHA